MLDIVVRGRVLVEGFSTSELAPRLSGNYPTRRPHA